MYAIEFESRIKNGMIEIPEEYRAKLSESVRVIVLAKEPSSVTSSNFIDQLLEKPIKTEQLTSVEREEVYQRIRAARGKYASVLSSSEEFAKRKQQEIDLER